jgi:hypothetical protein
MEELRKLIAEWRRQALNRVSLASLSKPTDLDICADELEALLPTIEAELNAAASGTRYYRGDSVEMFPGTQRLVPERDTLERGVLMGLEAARKLIAENADIVEIVKDAEAKDTHASQGNQ